MLAEMEQNGEGFFHHAQRMSKQHDRYFKNHPFSQEKIQFFENLAKESLILQQQIEQADSISFDEYLEDYFNNA
jgi:glutamate--cysteine ligase